jgi:hypothetical protein
LKKILLSILITASLAPAACADLWAIRSYLEIMGQYSMVFNAKDVMSVPADGSMYHLVFLPSLDFNGVFMFGGNDGIFSLYVKKDYIELHNKDTVLFSAAKNYYITNDEPWGLHYVGVGGRKYFYIDSWATNRFLPYAGMDLGGYFTSDTVSNISIRDGSNSVKAAGSMLATGGFFGLNAEAGVDYWLINEVAIVGKIGYRYCFGTIRSRKVAETTAFAGTLADVYDMETDYSGFYLQLGISFNFMRYD